MTTIIAEPRKEDKRSNEQEKTDPRLVLKKEATPDASPKKASGIKGGLKKEHAAIAGAAGAFGIAAGAGGAMAFTNFKEPDEAIEPPKDETSLAVEPDNFDGEQVQASINVTDDMNFAEAFACARNELGPGGVFQWRGNVYGTYYADEWKEFSNEFKLAFSSFPYETENDAHVVEYLADADIIEIVDDNDNDVVVVSDNYDNYSEIVVIDDDIPDGEDDVINVYDDVIVMESDPHVEIDDNVDVYAEVIDSGEYGDDLMAEIDDDFIM